jgi:hypothetical protein
MTKNILTTAAVRKAYADGTLNPADVKDAKGNPVSTASLFGAKGDGVVRGRIHPLFAAHAEANLNGTFAERVSTEKMVTITPKRLNSKGQPVRFKERQVSLSEVRRLAGVEGKKGRLSQADLDKAAEALGEAKSK